MKERNKKNGLVIKSITMCLVLILSILLVSTPGSIAEETHKEYLDGKLLLKISYGNENNSNGIMMATFQLRYLGGATVQTDSGDTIVEQIGIPVVTVYGQKLITMIEFQDEGYTPTNMFFEEEEDETVGAHNNLWDFKRKSDRIDNLEDSFIYTEPIIKALDLNTSWTISEISKKELGESNKMEIDFSLTANDLEYGDDKDQIWDPDFVNDDTAATEVEKIEFTFHIEVQVKKNEKINDIPWYTITINADDGDNIKVTDSESEGTRDFEGFAANADFKFDHLVEGWDFKDGSKDSKLMLETFSIFGTFIPDIVNEWFDKQFVSNIDDALGVAEYSYDNAGNMVDEVISDEGELPNTAQLVQKEHITFRDNWRQVGNMSWISTAEVDKVTKDIYFQIHAGQNATGRGENDDGYFHALIILGGYIYPQGDVIFHDPTFTAIAHSIPGLMEISFNLLSEGGICLQLSISFVAIVVSMVILVRRKGKEKELKERYNQSKKKDDNVDWE
jgi:hypothetical protein